MSVFWPKINKKHSSQKVNSPVIGAGFGLVWFGSSTTEYEFKFEDFVVVVVWLKTSSMCTGGGGIDK